MPPRSHQGPHALQSHVYDLHGMRVDEALELVRCELRKLKPRTRVQFISGKGHHSQYGVSRIKEALGPKLTSWGAKWDWKDGTFTVTVPDEAQMRVPAVAYRHSDGMTQRPQIVVEQRTPQTLSRLQDGPHKWFAAGRAGEIAADALARAGSAEFPALGVSRSGRHQNQRDRQRQPRHLGPSLAVKPAQGLSGFGGAVAAEQEDERALQAALRQSEEEHARFTRDEVTDSDNLQLALAISASQQSIDLVQNLSSATRQAAAAAADEEAYFEALEAESIAELFRVQSQILELEKSSGPIESS